MDRATWLSSSAWKTSSVPLRKQDAGGEGVRGGSPSTAQGEAGGRGSVQPTPVRWPRAGAGMGTGVKMLLDHPGGPAKLFSYPPVPLKRSLGNAPGQGLAGTQGQRMGGQLCLLTAGEGQPNSDRFSPGGSQAQKEANPKPQGSTGPAGSFKAPALFPTPHAGCPGSRARLLPWAASALRKATLRQAGERQASRGPAPRAPSQQTYLIRWWPLSL